MNSYGRGKNFRVVLGVLKITIYGKIVGGEDEVRGFRV